LIPSRLLRRDRNLEPARQFLAAIGIAASVIGAFYYLKIIKTIYFDKPADGYAPAASRLESALIALTASLIVVGYFFNAALDSASAMAAAALH